MSEIHLSFFVFLGWGAPAGDRALREPALARRLRRSRTHRVAQSQRVQEVEAPARMTLSALNRQWTLFSSGSAYVV